MSFTFRKFKMVLLLLLVAAYSYGQARDAKNFIITPQTVVKTNLPKLDSCLFERTVRAKRHHRREAGKR